MYMYIRLYTCSIVNGDRALLSIYMYMYMYVYVRTHIVYIMFTTEEYYSIYYFVYIMYVCVFSKEIMKLPQAQH